MQIGLIEETLPQAHTLRAREGHLPNEERDGMSKEECIAVWTDVQDNRYVNTRLLCPDCGN